MVPIASNELAVYRVGLEADDEADEPAPSRSLGESLFGERVDLQTALVNAGLVVVWDGQRPIALHFHSVGRIDRSAATGARRGEAGGL